MTCYDVFTSHPTAARFLSSLVVSSTGCPAASDSFSASCKARVPIPFPCAEGSTTIPHKSHAI